MGERCVSRVGREACPTMTIEHSLADPALARAQRNTPGAASQSHWPSSGRLPTSWRRCPNSRWWHTLKVTAAAAAWGAAVGAAASASPWFPPRAAVARHCSSRATPLDVGSLVPMQTDGRHERAQSEAEVTCCCGDRACDNPRRRQIRRPPTPAPQSFVPIPAGHSRSMTACLGPRAASSGSICRLSPSPPLVGLGARQTGVTPVIEQANIMWRKPCSKAPCRAEQ